MNIDLHFLRPLWLLLLIPLFILGWRLFRKSSAETAWDNVCDAHLLPYVIQTKEYGRRAIVPVLMLGSLLFIILGLAGPTWSRLPVPTYLPVQPRIVIMDMSQSMWATDFKT